MKLRNIVCAMACSFSFLSVGQLTLSELPVSVGFYAENGIHPGVKIGTAYTFFSKQKDKPYRFKGMQQKFGDKLKLKELSFDYNLGFYSHPNNHTGCFTNVGLTYLRTKMRKSRQLGLSVEVGYLRRVNKFRTFELDSQGEISQLNGAGNNAAVISISPIFGKEFSNNSLRLFFKPSLQIITYNHAWVPNATAELGMVFNINRKNR